MASNEAPTRIQTMEKRWVRKKKKITRQQVIHISSFNVNTLTSEKYLKLCEGVGNFEILLLQETNLASIPAETFVTKSNSYGSVSNLGPKIGVIIGKALRRNYYDCKTLG